MRLVLFALAGTGLYVRNTRGHIPPSDGQKTHKLNGKSENLESIHVRNVHPFAYQSVTPFKEKLCIRSVFMDVSRRIRQQLLWGVGVRTMERRLGKLRI